MAETILFLVYATVLLLYGVYLSASFAGVRFSRQNMGQLFGLCLFCGALQAVAYLTMPPSALWEIYPFITHLPLILFLCLVYRKRVSTAVVAVCTAYLWCQPSKWFGVLTYTLTDSLAAEYLARIFAILVVAFLSLRYFSKLLSVIYNKDTRSVCIFGIMPVFYYIFDYFTMIYTDLWASNNRIVAEFLPFFLGITYTIFCLMYHKEYEQKNDAERNEQIIRITVDAQAKEIEAAKRSEYETKLLRHDMRLLLSNLATCIENGENDKAQEMIATYTTYIQGTKLQHFCQNDTLNSVLSNFDAKCRSEEVRFLPTVELSVLRVDEILFASILSNALDNALNAQKALPPEQRSISLTLKSAHNKLLLSVENPTAVAPTFVDGLPITHRQGHGYGTQSIRYMTERLGGNCQFLMQGDLFVLRVII